MLLYAQHEAYGGFKDRALWDIVESFIESLHLWTMMPLSKELHMSKTVKWTIGIVVGLVVLFLLPFAWRLIFPIYGYGMMGGYGRMPMMGGYGYGFMPFGMIFIWLIPLGLLVLIGLGIAALVKYLANKPQ